VGRGRGKVGGGWGLFAFFIILVVPDMTVALMVDVIVEVYP
jgi:hypothetical protein